ncbi:MAG: D-alanyl-D-alanine carboxypeptidase family protein [Anaerosomatales bacterium]|nr:D-alanyl-D-alanine carboxypeptidase family protein [Anaerosomatales bacterium]
MQTLATCALAAVVWSSAAVAAGSVRPTDRVDGRPVSASSALQAVAPDLGCAAGVLVTGDGQELWSRAADERRAMASITKVMTAIVVLESVKDLEEPVVVDAKAAAVGESEAGFVSGQRMTARSLLEAMLVHSANDAAAALAIHVAGSEAAFVDRMNAKAEQLDARDTHFANVHGLDSPGHYTTAHDLAVIARYALSIPEFRSIVGMRSVSVPAAWGLTRYENSNKLIGSYPGATGVKTGWTGKAGYCLVASAEREGVELVAVVLGTRSENERFVEARTLLDWGFVHYRVRELVSAGTTVAAVPVEDYLDVAVPAVVATSASAPVFDVRGALEASVAVAPGVRAPVRRGDEVGTLTVLQGGTIVTQIPVVAARDVRAPAWHERVRIWAARVWRRVFGGQLRASLTIDTPAIR